METSTRDLGDMDLNELLETERDIPDDTQDDSARIQSLFHDQSPPLPDRAPSHSPGLTQSEKLVSDLRFSDPAKYFTGDPMSDPMNIEKAADRDITEEGGDGAGRFCFTEAFKTQAEGHLAHHDANYAVASGELIDHRPRDTSSNFYSESEKEVSGYFSVTDHSAGSQDSTSSSPEGVCDSECLENLNDVSEKSLSASIKHALGSWIDAIEICAPLRLFPAHSGDLSHVIKEVFYCASERAIANRHRGGGYYCYNRGDEDHGRREAEETPLQAKRSQTLLDNQMSATRAFLNNVVLVITFDTGTRKEVKHWISVLGKNDKKEWETLLSLHKTLGQTSARLQAINAHEALSKKAAAKYLRQARTHIKRSPIAKRKSRLRKTPAARRDMSSAGLGQSGSTEGVSAEGVSCAFSIASGDTNRQPRAKDRQRIDSGFKELLHEDLTAGMVREYTSLTLGETIMKKLPQFSRLEQYMAFESSGLRFHVSKRGNEYPTTDNDSETIVDRSIST
ncbi:hypothetical protein JHW43_008651 [Diplocarpon mali]|nr:hypothetical protein JHW43_008651 [Diplocarpon mali]